MQGDFTGLRLFQPPEPERSKNTTFLLGVGCQKGGTTWLHHYLRDHPEADMGFRREYHVLDAMHLSVGRKVLAAETACGRRMLEWFSQLKQNAGEYTMLDFYSNIECYYDYFEYLASRRDNVRVVGDITPSYAGLPPEAFASVRRALEERGIAVRVVFLMRDPVDRVWSALRMRHVRLRSTAVHHVADIRKLFRTHEYAFRTRYDETIRSLEAAFTADQLFFQFHETLFSAETMLDITDFLGLRFIEPDTETRVNASPSFGDAPESLQREIADFFGPVYEFCAARFGSNLISRIWPNYRFIRPTHIAHTA